MKKIWLTNKKFALVSDAGYEKAMAFNPSWSLQLGTRGKNKKYRAMAWVEDGDRIVGRLLHRILMDAKPGQIIDHKNGNPLDCRESNMRFCTLSQNRQNSKQHKLPASGFIGVRKQTLVDRWYGTVATNGKINYTGQYSTPHEAAIERDEIAQTMHGEFAVLNFPENVK